MPSHVDVGPVLESDCRAARFAGLGDGGVGGEEGTGMTGSPCAVHHREGRALRRDARTGRPVHHSGLEVLKEVADVVRALAAHPAHVRIDEAGGRGLGVLGIAAGRRSEFYGGALSAARPAPGVPGDPPSLRGDAQNRSWQPCGARFSIDMCRSPLLQVGCTVTDADPMPNPSDSTLGRFHPSLRSTPGGRTRRCADFPSR